VFRQNDFAKPLLIVAVAGLTGLWSIAFSVIITRDGTLWVEAAQDIYGRITGTTRRDPVAYSGAYLPLESFSGSRPGWNPDCRHLFFPLNGQIGFSVGVNGIAVFERQVSHFPALAVYHANIGTEWNHVAVTYKDKKCRIILNGKYVRVGLTSSRSEVFSAARMLGGHENPDVGNFKGAVREVAIWNRALSADEIAANMNGDTCPDGLAAFWPFDEGAGDTAADRSGQASNAQIMGAKWELFDGRPALLFDGPSDIVLLDYPAPKESFTIAAWVKPDAPNSTDSGTLDLDAGFPFMLALWRILLGRFGLGDGPLEWAFAGQTLGLVCMMLSLFPLFYIGRRLVGSTDAFVALFMLILLPDPTKWAHDALREWPQLLFLATGLLVMICAFKRGSLVMLFLVGVLAGLRHTIRSECAQLILYASIGLVIALLRPTATISRARALIGIPCLFLGFAAVLLPYASYRDQYAPSRVNEMLSTADTLKHAEPQEETIHAGPAKTVEGAALIVQRLSESLHYYFFPFMVVGLCSFFRRGRIPQADRWWLTAFIAFNLLMLIAFHSVWGHMERRYVFPLTAVTVFFVPAGMKNIAAWLAQTKKDAEAAAEKYRVLILASLLLVGVAICLPKTVRPKGYSSSGLRKTADYLRRNTPPDAIVAVPDSRVGFYSDRRRVMYKARTPSGEWEYLVTMEEPDEDSRFGSEPSLTLVFSCPLRTDRPSARVVTYRRMMEPEVSPR